MIEVGRKSNALITLTVIYKMVRVQIYQQPWNPIFQSISGPCEYLLFLPTCNVNETHTHTLTLTAYIPTRCLNNAVHILTKHRI